MTSMADSSTPADSAASPMATAGQIGSNVGRLEDNLPELITAFWLTEQTGELIPILGVFADQILFPDSNAIVAGQVREKIRGLGGIPVGNTPAEFDAYQRAELEKWSRIVKESGAKVD